ncbi:MAG: YceI family protein [Flavobacteriales bacterium]|jgi:polyisoprenoid-binding protein YceI|nr:YceI family protein [Flavobacteriales bacterium]MDP4716703.1 YceI family protein [Flavobacteriales bacterium]MDP4817886.1 YceI family protein [Flavobacteriales bacterium]MDP4950236.1 YceI family protein [Flavobacteriales bacterium]
MSKQIWNIDPSHSEIGFKVRHMMITNVNGVFNSYTATMAADAADFSDAEISFEADIDSVNTRNEQRDGHLKSPEFFDVEKFPKLSFKSTSFTKTGDGQYLMKGHFDMHGVQKEVSMNVEFTGTVVDPWGQVKTGFEITGSLNRSEYGLTWNATSEDGSIVLDEVIKLALNVQMIKQV